MVRQFLRVPGNAVSAVFAPMARPSLPQTADLGSRSVPGCSASARRLPTLVRIASVERPAGGVS